MRVPLSWLEELVDLPDLERLVSGLNSQGLKVEAVEGGAEGLRGVVVAKVLDIQPHPNADRLTLVGVQIGEENRRVVCGAKNFKAGDLVPYAPPGAELPGGLKLERRKVRGELSDGMLCSAKELGISEDHTGILVLPDSSELGEDVIEVLGLGERVLVLDITPNRPDAMSLLGVAREVRAMTGAEIIEPDAPYVAAAGALAADAAAIEVHDREGCPRYLAKVLRAVKVAPSPRAVQARLSAAGMRPISNVVDATNYALMVMGHPMHAFDLGNLGGRRIIVRSAHDGETITTLDGEERTLVADDLVIADADRPVALAGIMGGADTEVSAETTEVLLESAYFTPARVLRASQRHALRTEASARFERGMDPSVLEKAADYACSIVQQWASAEVLDGNLDVGEEPRKPIHITLRPERVNSLLGTDITTQQVTRSLASLGFEVSEEAGQLDVEIPTRRPDVTIEEDLIEEVARVVGYDLVPTTLPRSEGRIGGLTEEQRRIRLVREILIGAGLTEAYTSSFLSEQVHARLGYGEDTPHGRPLRIVNPISKNEALLRPSLLPGLLDAVERNVKRRHLTLSLFEVGKCFLRSGHLLPNEPLLLGLVMHGPVPKYWSGEGRDLDFFDLKGAIEVLCEGLGIRSLRFEDRTDPLLHARRSASISIGDTEIGRIGELSDAIADGYELTHRALLAELDLKLLLDQATQTVTPPPPSRFPAVLIDVAVEVPESVAAEQVSDLIRAHGGEMLGRVRLFDLYRGEQVRSGHKSLAYSLEFRAPDRTLTDEEAVAVRDAIADGLAKTLGAQVRGAV